MKKILLNILGFGSPFGFMSGMILILLGMIILGDGEIGIKATSTSEVQWITAFASLDNWFGWIFIWFGFDSFFNGKLTNLLIDKILSPILNPIVKAILGEEKLKKIQEKIRDVK